MEVQTNLLLQAALEYAAKGWLVVPDHCVMPDGSCTCSKGKACESKGKHPRVKEWHLEASADEEKVVGWWQRWPMTNVGVQLGEKSGIIDFETDNEEGERLLAEMFQGEPPITPTYTSGRGKHRLFRWRPGLPRKANMPLPGVDVKLGAGGMGSQSVFPPSRHASGKSYCWLIDPNEVDLAEIPDQVLVWMVNREGMEPGDLRQQSKKTAEDWRKVVAPKAAGEGRNNAEASFVGGLLRRLPSLEDQEGVEMVYQAAASLNRGNLDPQSESDFDKTFQSILRKEQQRRATEAADAVLSRTPEEITEQGAKDGVVIPRGMKLVIVHDDPPFYELHASQFHRAHGKFIKLTASQLCSFQALKIQALEQAGYPLPKAFQKAWDLKGGLFEQLVLGAEERSVTAVTKQLAMTAEYLLGRLDAAKERTDESEAPDNRKPTLMKDGSVWFRWEETWKDALLGGAIKREDVKRLAHAVEVTGECIRYWPHKGKGRKRYVSFGKELMARLEAIAESSESVTAHAESTYIAKKQGEF